jgi:hypothetical protein
MDSISSKQSTDAPGFRVEYPESSRERGTGTDRAYPVLRLPQLFEKS